MKKLIYSLLFISFTFGATAQQYYPLASPCDPDKVFEKLPSAAYENVCIQLLRIKSQPFNDFPKEIFRYPNLKE